MSNENFALQLQEILDNWDLLKFNVHITNCLNKSKNIAIFGAGQNGIKTADILTRANYKYFIFIDDTPAKIGTSIKGISVLSSEQARTRFSEDLTVIVSIFNVHHSFRTSQLRFEGYGWKVLSFVQIGMALSEQFAPFYFMDMPQAYDNKIANLHTLYSQLLDADSKAELIANIKFRLTLNFEHFYTKPMPHFSYIANLIPSNCHFIDGGAFDGDTIRAFIKIAGNKYAKISAFEPDPNNFAKLQQYTHSLPTQDQQSISIRPEGLWSSNCKLNFAANGTPSSSFTENANGTIDVTYVDSIIEPGDIVVLKLDVEGAEIEAIKGAIDLFKRGMVIGAISVYHKVNDLWEIPKVIHDINPGYRFGLPSHASDGIDLTLYAIPPSLTHMKDKQSCSV